MEEPPIFNFNIVSTFKDPLTRQLAESVRIERRCQSILNCTSEYSRCRVPHLRVDMEEWKSKVKDVVQVGSETGTGGAMGIGQCQGDGQQAGGGKKYVGR